jgi:phytoene dehydrogenase-like protein
MTDFHDVVVIGGGHNGLTAAAYLARAGRRVVVLEAQDTFGGTAASVEFAPGIRAPMLFATVDMLHPSVVSDLDLEKHGLQMVSGAAHTTVLGASEPLQLAADGASLQLSEADQRAYREFELFLSRIASALQPIMGGALPPIETVGVGAVFELLTLGWRMRRLGRRDMPQAMRLLPMSLRDIVQERFDDERLRAAIAWRGLAASWLGPWSPGGGYTLLYHRPAWGGPLFGAPTFAVGGSGGVAAALVSAAKAAGAELRSSARVARVRVDDDRAVGVVLEDGEEIPCQAVMSAIDPRTTLTGLLDTGWLDPDYVAAAQNIRMRGTVAAVRMAIDTVPQVPGVDESAWAGRVQIGDSLAYLEHAFDAVKYGDLPERPVVDITVPSLSDSTLAPAGTHVIHAWVQYVPHAFSDSSWDSKRDELAQSVIDAIEQHAPGFASSVQHVDVTTPADLEGKLGILGGHPYHGELSMDQLLYMRPIAGWYDHRTPVDGLYLGGPGCHPGGGITGIPGKNAAARLGADWKTGRLG